MDIADLMGLPLKGKPTCPLDELSSYVGADGERVVDYQGADGCKYRCVIREGREVWKGWKRDLDL